MSVDRYRLQLDRLIRRGQEICAALAAKPGDAATEAAARVWQRDCASLVNELSGGSKAHWLSRAFSDAFLIPPAAHAPGADADPSEILRRLIDVLGRGATSLASLAQQGEAGQAVAPPPRPRRFDFVHNTELRPILEGALTDSQEALERADFLHALLLTCSILDAILADALEHAGGRVPPGPGAAAGPSRAMPEWPFETRIAAAERAGMIRNSCARLPPVARQYRDLTDEIGDLRSDAHVSARDARVAAQVLTIVMRDLDPGR